MNYKLFFFILFIFLIDEFIFIASNISFFQFLCGLNYSFIYYNNEQLLFNFNILNSIYNNFDLITEFSFYFNKWNFIIIEDLSNVISVDNLSYIPESDDFFIISIYFDSIINKKNILYFISLQNHLYVSIGETSLAFYRIENLSDTRLQLYSMFIVTPSIYSIYINKIQCFCFENIYIDSYETLDLPILFFIDNTIISDILILHTIEITIEYILLINNNYSS
jgi:hypothetical protein